MALYGKTVYINELNVIVKNSLSEEKGLQSKYKPKGLNCMKAGWR